MFAMPAIRHASKRKAPPEGFSDIETDLLIFANKMKDAQNRPPPTGPKHQAQWEIFQISHQRSRYVYDLYYEKEAISRELYEWLLKNGYADAMLIAKWKKQGYEKVLLPTQPTVGVSCQGLKFFSCAAFAVYRPRRPTSTRRAFAEFLRPSSRRTRTSSASTAAAEAVPRATEEPRAMGEVNGYLCHSHTHASGNPEAAGVGALHCRGHVWRGLYGREIALKRLDILSAGHILPSFYLGC